MSSNDRGPVDRAGEGAGGHAEVQASGRVGERERAIHLESTVVRYEARSDRCTVFPQECTEVEKLTTWLSADLSAFVDLESAR